MATRRLQSNQAHPFGRGDALPRDRFPCTDPAGHDAGSPKCGPTARQCAAMCVRGTRSMSQRGACCRSVQNGTKRGITRLLHVKRREPVMNNIIYIVGLVVVVLAVLSFFGLR